MNEPEYISVRQAASRIGIGKDLMFRVVKQPGFPCVKIGKRYVIHRERFDKWMKEHEGREIVVD